ncbi:MAG TPA: hypothetical protein DCG48_03465 [Rhodospirillaceae bacterium]|nr:hypothetical protein [Rhodospirillaceae bacterium]
MSALARTAASLSGHASPRYPVPPALAPTSDDINHVTSSAPDRDGARETTYYAVLHTEPWHGEPSTKWTEALLLLAALAEESPGYLGYEVQEMDGGREYAITHWSAPEYIRQWKKSSALLVGDNGLMGRICGQEGCFWPWLDNPTVV